MKYCFADADDVITFQVSSSQDAVRLLEDEVAYDEALLLALIGLDSFEERSIRLDAVTELSLLISQPAVFDRTRNALFKAVLSSDADLGGIITLAEGLESALALYSELQAKQAPIGLVADCWHAIDDSEFEDTFHRHRFEKHAVTRGAFRRLADGILDGNSGINSATIDVLLLLKDVPSHRQIVLKWVNGIRTASGETSKRIGAIAEFESREFELTAPSARGPSGYQAFQEVQAQKRAISAQLHQGNIDLARKFMAQLIRRQLDAQTPDLAAKSLSSLSQQANAVGQYSTQLEWATWATQLAPGDSQSFAHVADACIFLSRFQEALEALAEVERVSPIERSFRFAATERARILRLQGRLDEALSAFSALKATYGATEENSFAWNGFAEVLRDMQRSRDAADAYDEARRIFPENSSTLCGYAAALTQLGQIDKALSVYDEALSLHGDHIYALVGKAAALRATGEVVAPRELLAHAEKRYPHSPIVLSSKIQTERAAREFGTAMRLALRGIKRFPNEPGIAAELGEVYRDLGRLDDAVVHYRRSIAQFSNRADIRFGLAQTFKDQHRYGEALQVLDENVRAFPYDYSSKLARADILKRLRRFEDSVDAYDSILSKWPDRKSARHSKAALLVVLGEFAEAERLLPTSKPETPEEWFASHIRGMILLKTDRVDEAIEHFRWGAENVPFEKSRVSFITALSVALLRHKEFRRAVDVLMGESEPVANVLRLHAFAANNERLAAFIAMNDVLKGPPEIIELGYEIARVYGLHEQRASNDEAWIFSRECQVVLLEAA